ncbi:MAG: hypothetical protein ACE3JQ_11340 [Paenisporosarcina sp.]
MKRFLLLVILALSTQLIAIIMWGEYVWLYRSTNGGVSGTPLGQVQPILWFIIVLEFILFITFYFKRKNE